MQDQTVRQDVVTGARDGAAGGKALGKASAAASGTPGRGAEAGAARREPGPVAPGREDDRSHGREAGRRILSRAAEGGASGRSSRRLERDAIVTMEHGRVRVLVPSAFMAEYVGRNYMLALREAAAEEMGRSGSSPRAEDVPVDVVVEPGAFVREGVASVRPAGAEEAQGGPRLAVEGAGGRTARRPVGARDLRHRLGDFVVGECNRIAYTAACAVAEGTAPPRFSPMFLHGPSGVGKTHLLQGLAQRASERLADRGGVGGGARVRYTTAETFTNDFVQALKSNSTDAFRRGFRDVEILCIDDIHFLAGKSATQAEFLHTFDTLGLNGRMVVLASDEAPRDIRSLGEALVSRFLSGACIKVEPPDDATRLELVRRLSAARGLGLDEDAVGLVADRSGRPLPGGSLPSVREIEGLLTRIEAMRNFMAPGEFDAPGGVIGRSMVAKALGLTSSDGRAPRRPVPSSLIIERVCRALRVDASDLMGRGRHARVVLARALVTYLSRRMTTMSYPEIARSMARPNHSTVITAFNRVKRQMASGQMVEGGPDLAEVSIQSLVDRLEREITSAAG